MPARPSLFPSPSFATSFINSCLVFPHHCYSPHPMVNSKRIIRRDGRNKYVNVTFALSLGPFVIWALTWSSILWALGTLWHLASTDALERSPNAFGCSRLLELEYNLDLYVISLASSKYQDYIDAEYPPWPVYASALWVRQNTIP